MIWILAGLALGVVVGFYIPFTYPANYSLYMSVAILATIDSIFGAVKSGLNGKYDYLRINKNLELNDIINTYIYLQS